MPGPGEDADAVGDALGAAARRSAVGRVAPGERPTGRALLDAVGGIRGLVESILPGLLFLIVFTVTFDVVASVLAPVAIAIVFIVVRVVRREPLATAIAGAAGIGISAAFALFTGEARDNFVPGFLVNAGIALLMLVSIAARRPFIGVVVGLLAGDPDWRADRAKARVALVATILWASFPLLRLAVELPLYFAEATAALGAAKLILGVPLYAGVLWVTWLLVRSAWDLGPGRGNPDGDGADAGAPGADSSTAR